MEKNLPVKDTEDRAQSGTPSSLLGRLFAPLAPKRFLAEHWPTRLCAGHGEPRRLEGLCELAPLRDIAHLLSVFRGDAKLVFSDAEGRHRELAAEPLQALALYQAGLTVCCAAISEWVPGVRAWADRLGEELGVPARLVGCNAYASRSGGGFGKHWDSHEVIIVQLVGSKRWSVAESSEVSFPHTNYIAGGEMPQELQAYLPEAPPRAMPPGTVEVELRPGSALFLPRGTWHATSATEGDSLSLTFGFNLPSRLELVLQHLRSRLVLHPRWREPAWDLGAGAGRRERMAAQLSPLLAELAGDLGHLDGAEVLRSFDARAPRHEAPAGERAGPGGRRSARRFRRPEGVSLEVRTPSGEDAEAIDGGEAPEEPLATVAIRTPGGDALELEVEADMAGAFEWIRDRVEPFSEDDLHEAAAHLPRGLVQGILDALVSNSALEELPGHY